MKTFSIAFVAATAVAAVHASLSHSSTPVAIDHHHDDGDNSATKSVSFVKSVDIATVAVETPVLDVEIKQEISILSGSGSMSYSDSYSQPIVHKKKPSVKPIVLSKSSEYKEEPKVEAVAEKKSTEEPYPAVHLRKIRKQGASSASQEYVKRPLIQRAGRVLHNVFIRGPAKLKRGLVARAANKFGYARYENRHSSSTATTGTYSYNGNYYKKFSAVALGMQEKLNGLRIMVTNAVATKKIKVDLCKKKIADIESDCKGLIETAPAYYNDYMTGVQANFNRHWNDFKAVLSEIKNGAKDRFRALLAHIDATEKSIIDTVNGLKAIAGYAYIIMHAVLEEKLNRLYTHAMSYKLHHEDYIKMDYWESVIGEVKNELERGPRKAKKVLGAIVHAGLDSTLDALHLVARGTETAVDDVLETIMDMQVKLKLSALAAANAVVASAHALKVEMAIALYDIKIALATLSAVEYSPAYYVASLQNMEAKYTYICDHYNGPNVDALAEAKNKFIDAIRAIRRGIINLSAGAELKAIEVIAAVEAAEKMLVESATLAGHVIVSAAHEVVYDVAVALESLYKHVNSEVEGHVSPDYYTAVLQYCESRVNTMPSGVDAAFDVKRDDYLSRLAKLRALIPSINISASIKVKFLKSVADAHLSFSTDAGVDAGMNIDAHVGPAHAAIGGSADIGPNGAHAGGMMGAGVDHVAGAAAMAGAGIDHNGVDAAIAGKAQVLDVDARGMIAGKVNEHGADGAIIGSVNVDDHLTIDSVIAGHI